jgi:hypothetical protein
MIEHPADDLVAYALGELRPAERRAVDAHLDGCAACRAEAAAIGETVWEVVATAARDVPPGLRDAVVGRARSASRATARPRPGAALWTWLLRPVPAAAPLALGALLLVALVAVAGARQDADRYARLLGAVAGAQVTPLAATAPGTELRGALSDPRPAGAACGEDLGGLGHPWRCPGARGHHQRPRSGGPPARRAAPARGHRRDHPRAGRRGGPPHRVACPCWAHLTGVAHSASEGQRRLRPIPARLPGRACQAAGQPIPNGHGHGPGRHRTLWRKRVGGGDPGRAGDRGSGRAGAGPVGFDLQGRDRAGPR